MTDLRPQIDRDGMAQHLGAQPRVVLGYLFGSVAQGRADALSDVDVAVLLDESLDAEERLEETLRLMGELEPYTGGEVQVVLLNEAPPLLAYRVAEEGALLYARSEAERIAFQVRARKLYFDFRPRLAFHTRALLRDIEEVGLSGRRRRPGGALEAARRIHERLAGVHGRDV